MRSLKRAIRKRFPLLAALGLVAILFTIYVWGIPWVMAAIGPRDDDPNLIRLGSGEQNLTRLMTAIFTFWFFFVGATIGSFLNVVVYRMPLGKSVVFKPSHCPFCKDPIRAYHNIPIFGWLSLNGRCRKCRLPISSRYPLIELICGLIFLLLFFVELCSGGWNLPFRDINEKVGVVRTVFDPKWDLIGASLFHLFLFCTLLTGSLIHWDRQTIPKRFWITSGGIALLVGCLLPTAIGLVPWSWPILVEPPNLQPNVGGLIHCGLGIFVGTFIGLMIHLTLNKKTPTCFNWSHGIPIVLGLTGAFLGWQASLVIAACSLLIAILAFPIVNASNRQVHVPWFMVFSIGALVHHLFWRILMKLLIGPSQSLTLLLFGAIFLSIFVFAIGMRILDRKPEMDI